MRLTTVGMLIVVITTTTCDQRSPSRETSKAGKDSALCRVEDLPSTVQDRLKEELGSWKIHEPNRLASRARERWEAEKPLSCPGIAVGQFEGTENSYAIALVRQEQSSDAYKLIVVSGASFTRVTTVEQSKDGASSIFIRGVPMERFFDEESKKKFGVSTRDGILIAVASDKEYETSLYFWVKGGYQKEPVDY